VVIAAQVKAIEELAATNARLVERVAALERIEGRNSGNSLMPVGAEQLIHNGDLRHRLRVAVGHDRRPWRYDCSISSPGNWWHG
jgi:hypothetical protein